MTSKNESVRYVYILTAFNCDYKHLAMKPVIAHIMGFFETMEQAEEAVLNNHGDIQEAGYHKTLVVEEVAYPCVNPLGVVKRWYWLVGDSYEPLNLADNEHEQVFNWFD